MAHAFDTALWFCFQQAEYLCVALSAPVVFLTLMLVLQWLKRPFGVLP